MRLALKISLLAVLTAVVAGLGAGNASAHPAADVGAATALAPVSAQVRGCERLAARKARTAASRSHGSAAARAARRTRARVQRRCLVRLRQAAAKRRRAKTSTVAAPPSGNLVIGIDGGYAGWSPSEIQERTELGAAVTRHEWDPSEPVDAQDEVVEVAAGTIHTRIHALLGGNQLGDPTHYREWVVSFIRRYGPGGSFWAAHPELDASRYAITSVELGNEPYFGEMSAAEYADTVRPTLESIRDLGLPVTVMLPAYVYGDDTSWIDTMYERIPDLNTLFDGFAFHPYWYGHDPATPGDGGPFERIDTVRAAMDGLGAASKPIYLTEYGESTAGCGGECVSEATQAEHLREMIETVVANTDWNVDMLSIFQLRDRGTNSGDRELQFGLLREDGLPKPSYGIVRAAMQVHR